MDRACLGRSRMQPSFEAAGAQASRNPTRGAVILFPSHLRGYLQVVASLIVLLPMQCKRTAPSRRGPYFWRH